MPSTLPIVRVGLLDDQPLFLEMLHHLLKSVPGFQVRSARSIAEASDWNPQDLDVAVLDLQLPDGSGLGFGQTLKRRNPALGLVLLSAVDHSRFLLELERIDGWSYLSKRTATSTSDLVRTVRSSAKGGSLIDPMVLEQRQARAGTRLSALSQRQIEVLKLIAKGLTNSAIANQLGIAVNSVNNHVNAIYAALGTSGDETNPRVSAVRVLLEDSV